MAELFVDRLTLRLPPMPTWEARRLAQLVADGLTAADIAAIGPATGAGIHTRVEAPAGLGTERLASLIVAQVLRQIGPGS
jgi:hypothetical protein